MTRTGRSGVAVVVALAACLGNLATEAAAADWEWTIAPYIWGSGMSVDLTANNEPAIGADVSFSDLLDKTDLAGMIHFEGRGGKTGFFFDLLYLDLSAEVTTAPAPPLPGGTTVDSDLTTGIYEAGGLYRFLDDGQALDLLLGARLLDFEQEHEIALPSPSTVTTTIDQSDSLLDGFVGVRYGHPMGKRWDFVVRADAGAGDTELTWNAVGTVGVRFGETGRYSLRFGWREMEIEIDEESDGGVDLETDLTLSGPIIGFVITL